MKYACLTHKIELKVEGKLREYSGLSWAGTPNCSLLTMKKPKEGKYGDCDVVRA